MLTGELRNKIDSLWEMFWTGGVVNPLDVVEQMTYLMFIHDLDEVDTKKAKSSLMLELPYTSMFEGCTNLSLIKVYFTAWGAQTNNWVTNVKSTGTFYKPTALPEEYGISKIPPDWTVVNIH